MKETLRVKRTLTECKICAAPALYSYVGVIVCASCKMFFKRHAQSKKLRCYEDGHCEINKKNRYLCPGCRMKKCLKNGMQVDLIRNGRGKKVSHEHPQSLRTNASVLTPEQRTLICNLVHCYDQHSQYTVAEQFFQEQSRLPLKMRFRITAVHELLTQIISSGRVIFEKNRDFLSLRPMDRSMMLQKTIKQVLGLSSCLVMHQSKFRDNPTLYQMAEMIYGPSTVLHGARTMSYLDTDPIFLKLILGILMFSTFDCPGSDPMDIHAPFVAQDLLSIVRIHDMYVELAWRYLLYRHNHHHAVRSFSNLIRSLFSLQQSLNGAVELSHYHNTINTLVYRTEQTLCIR